MKILFIVSRLPYPLEKGDKLRAFYQIKGLSRFHDIHLFALNDSEVHPEAHNMLMQYCKSVRTCKLSRFSRIRNVVKSYFDDLPLQVGYFYNQEAKNILKEEIKFVKPDVIYCQLLRTAEYVKGIKKIPKVIDYQDVFSEGMKRRSEKDSPFLKPIFKMEHKRLVHYENKIFDVFDKHIIISPTDREKISHHEKEKIFIVPNGVDTNFYKPSATEKKYDLLFTGNMQYAPNIFGAEFLINKILPLLKSAYPDVKILIAGAHPVKSIRKLSSENVTVSGWIPDIRNAYNESRIFIAPMLIGTGLQNKLLEAMAMKLPCITSPLANASLGAPVNKAIFVATTADEYVRHIIYLLQHPLEAQTLAEEGHKFITENYNWEKIINSLSTILQSAKS